MFEPIWVHFTDTEQMEHGAEIAQLPGLPDSMAEELAIKGFGAVVAANPTVTERIQVWGRLVDGV
jgi:hypothetical protein